ncbi:MAG: type III-A CRISPR-associated protein Cas10/Csm1 [Bacteroidaceae bacterium]|nr:type III-A CRISPR-associated protein Cas10/Csm1 [Bacteroidaceae bacterium]
MENDLLYKTALLQGLARQYPQFAEISSRHSMLVADEFIDEAMRLAAGCSNCVPEQIECRPMQPIFATVGSGVDGTWTLPAGELTLDKGCFAKKGQSQHNHTPQLERLATEIDKLENMSPKAFAETLLTLLYKYAAQIPAGIKGLDDVSLYDYLKTVAALSLSLSATSQEPEDKKPFLLLGADFSGIQRYIYTITPKRAAKSLKGRSFYLRLLSDAIVRYLLKQLGLYNANVIYNSGGSFYILAPNTSTTRERIAAAVRRIEEALFNELGTQLFVAIDYVEMSRDALLGNGATLPDVWRELFLKRDKKKSHKFSSILGERYESFFATGTSAIETKKDSVTGEDFLPGEKVVAIKGDNGVILHLRPSTALQIEIGKVLRNTDTLVVLDSGTLETNLLTATPLNLGITYCFLDSDKELTALDGQLQALGDRATIVSLNGDKALPHHAAANIHTIEFYGGNEMLRVARTYEDMSEGENFTRMGVLRMDVDNLGTIFQSGIAADKATLSRYAALSRSFDYFFSGYLNSVWENFAPDRSQIIYSGGDDLFIVGRWDTTIELARRIRNDFKEYTCYNKSFSLSGGVAIVPPKYPIMAAAEESAGEETLAKEHVCGNRNKDSISFMGQPLNWEKEYPVVNKLKNTLVGLLAANKLPSSLIQKVLLHAANAGIENHTITNIKTYWMIAYDMKRMQQRIGRNANGDVGCIIENFKKEIYDTDVKRLNGEPVESIYHPLELWSLAARWAELENRTNKNT